LGIHTGDSIVVAPSQTLTNNEYHTLRKASIDIVRSLGIVGECNVQFALNPHPKNSSLEFYVIEVNARLSRSSALASKATGYPLAYVAAKLALGYNLTKLKNKVTGVTSACFEPALDYIVTKIPRFDLDKFKGAEQTLGSSMKSVGEVMGIGRTFEESFQKAIRMLDMDREGVTSDIHTTDITEALKTPTPKRMFVIADALKQKITVQQIHELSGIDPWFIQRIKNIINHEVQLKKSKKLDMKSLKKLKQLGVSDKRVGELVGKTGLEIRTLRKKLNILPAVLQIDTLAGEFPAQTNYLYMTYNESHHDITPSGNKAVIVLGSGPYHIGSSVEFDWCSVNTVERLKKYKKQAITINCNPETVSTDYDVSDKLYFEELTFERIADIYEYENPLGAIVSVGGQTPNNRAQALHTYGLTILGTNPEDIDRAEDRSKFSALLDKLEIKQPAWNAFSTLEDAEAFAEEVGYPVLIRPSYVLSGSAMNICFNKKDLKTYLEQAASVSQEYPVTVSKFFTKALEVELDAISQNGIIKAVIISEHIEYAGVHSGDATIVLPAKNIDDEMQNKMRTIAAKLAKKLTITGPFNIQFLVKDDEIYIIETNLRASRTFPFIAKVTGINLITLFVDALFTKELKTQTMQPLDFTAVKVAQFSFARLIGAHPQLGVEMASTGEVACFGKDVKEAYLKGILATNGKIPEKGVFVSLGGDQKKKDLLASCKLLAKLNLPIYATEKTAKFLNKNGVRATMLYKIHEEIAPNLLDYFQAGKIDLVINVVDTHLKKDLNDDYFIRRAAVDSNILVFTKIKKAELFIQALVEKGLSRLEIKPWSEYTKDEQS
ncbi:MAG TPA: carbamoyl-phosphate synthase (glutamine-hydrolyzing) large subunit, partial [Patescibacteria group bacterium]|nr:carbamoyl-phosphate synthase (glutamine-hydrolyzing) large subunit [Patescibacteria group bacterium]